MIGIITAFGLVIFAENVFDLFGSDADTIVAHLEAEVDI